MTQNIQAYEIYGDRGSVKRDKTLNHLPFQGLVNEVSKMRMIYLISSGLRPFQIRLFHFSNSIATLWIAVAMQVCLCGWEEIVESIYGKNVREG